MPSRIRGDHSQRRADRPRVTPLAQTRATRRTRRRSVCERTDDSQQIGAGRRRERSDNACKRSLYNARARRRRRPTFSRRNGASATIRASRSFQHGRADLSSFLDSADPDLILAATASSGRLRRVAHPLSCREEPAGATEDGSALRGKHASAVGRRFAAGSRAPKCARSARNGTGNSDSEMHGEKRKEDRWTASFPVARDAGTAPSPRTSIAPLAVFGLKYQGLQRCGPDVGRGGSELCLRVEPGKCKEDP